MRRWPAASGWRSSGSGNSAKSASPYRARPSRWCRWGSSVARAAVMRASSSRTTRRVSFPRAASAGSPRARKRSRPSPRSAAAGPGVSSWIGQWRGETTRTGVVGCPSRRVSRKPWTAAVKARRRITSWLTRLMPILRLIRSAGVSRMVRAVNGSSRALPLKPRLTSSTPVSGLIELPWCSQTRRPESGAGSTGASVRRAMSSWIPRYGSQISTSLVPSASPANRTVPGGPGVRTAAQVVVSTVRTFPPSAVARPAGRPSTRRSYTASGGVGAPR